MRSASPQRQRGAVIITVALFLLFLLGFMGIALDLGRMFVSKSELQTAMDACALSAAQELDGGTTALTRATSAGLTAGNANGVHFQSANWIGKGKMVATDITYRDSGYNVTTTPANARYAVCDHSFNGVQTWLLRAIGAITSDPNMQTFNVAASAAATRASAQSSCPVPLALKPKSGGVSPDYGFTTGEWVKLLMSPGSAPNGNIGWANLDGSNSASETEAELAGHCGTVVGDTLGTPGVQTSVADVWNARFGIYKNTGDPAVQRPDYSGYAYTDTNWPDPSGGANIRNAYDRATVPPGAGSTAANFITKRAQFASCADTGTNVRGANSCESITGWSLNGFQKLATPGAAATDGHRRYGQSRRLVTVPIVNGSNSVIDFACMFMLQPLSIPMADVWLEYRGNASTPGSPCTTSGMPGGSAGPLVPVLVR